MKGLIVKKVHFDQIVAGLKTQTRRKHVRPFKSGDLLVLTKGYSGEWTPRVVVEITRATRERLGDCSEEDARAEGFSGLAEFRDKWPIYTGCPWDPNLSVTVYEFRRNDCAHVTFKR